tara:strand:- start:3754 stop:4380 length:627 start_codon:yes stop_codon:yes gene_type:complete
MCGIFASFNRETFLKLLKLNKARGCYSYSYSTYDVGGYLDVERKAFGEFDESLVTKDGVYHIGHVQAPTTADVGSDNIHPSIYKDSHLWHNGILKEDTIEQLKLLLHLPQTNWDTELLNRWFSQQSHLSNIDGTFSCLRYNSGYMFLFRNEISPMFMNEDWDLSSVKFEGAKPTRPNTVWLMDFNTHDLINVDNFTTKENPYYFPGES